MVSSSSFVRHAALLAVTLGTAACAAGGGARMGTPVPDPRVGLRAGMLDAEEAVWNLRVLSKTPPPKDFVGETNSDLAFIGSLAIQGNYNGFQVWEIKDPAKPELVIGYVCPASQSDVSVYGNLLFVSGEGLSGRLDCGREGVKTAVSQDRLRGLRTSATRATWATCRPAADRTRTRCWWTRRMPSTCTCTSRDPPGCGRRRSCPGAPGLRWIATRTPPSSGSR